MALEQAEISRILEVAIVAARMAGQRAMEDIKYTKSSIKNGDEIVTEADSACQKLIIDRVKESYPDHGFIAEEGDGGKVLCQPPRAKPSVWWIIDPIDGTNNYSHGLLDFSVSIGVFCDNEPIVGVIFAPATESMFTAAKGADAQLNASRINVSDEELSVFAHVAVDSHYTEELEPIMMAIMHKARFRNLGSTCLHLAYVSSGAMAASIASSVRVWDIAAGAFIIETAGGMATDFAGKKIFPLDVENSVDKRFNIVAANTAGVHAAIQQEMA